jgi:hypothetical protein
MTTIRNADLADLVEVLKDRHSRKVDVIAPATKIHAENGNIRVENAEQVISADGVTSNDLTMIPTAVMDEGIGQKLGIPANYVRKMREERTDLWDANVNGWLQGSENASPDDRSFLIRSFAAGEGDEGKAVGRAFLSDKFKIIDDLDALTAALDGVRRAGVDVDIKRCDLTERKMYVRINAPQIRGYAPDLFKGYRAVTTGDNGDRNPWVEAGITIRNSEVGDGAFVIVPTLTALVCNNGMTMTKDAMRAVHLGARQDEGVIRWSDETQAKTIELITLKAADAVSTFMDVDYINATLSDLTAKAGKPIEGPLDKAVRTVAKKLAFGEEMAEGVLDHFMRGGQFTAGGMMHAVTSFSQSVADADDAYALEDLGVKALETAYAL